MLECIYLNHTEQ